MSKKILVFGASGFIGTYLIDELLSKGYEVVASDISDAGCEYYGQKNVPYIHVDITQKSAFDSLKKQKYHAVIHLAACQPANVGKDSYDACDYIDVNVIGTLNILDFCRDNDAGKIIYVSSHRNTQGLWSSDRAIREEDGRAIKYTGEYAMFSIAESAAQDCVKHYQEQYGLKGVIFRLPPVYGYGPHTEIFKDGKRIKTGFQIFIDKAIACQPLEVWGDADVGRDIIYVKDVVSAFMMAITNSEVSGLFNIASGKYLTLREQAKTIAKIFWRGNTSPEIIENPNKSNEIDAFLYDISKAEREFGWRPRFTFEDMLIDYKKEMESRRYQYLLEKRRLMFKST